MVPLATKLSPWNHSVTRDHTCLPTLLLPLSPPPSSQGCVLRHDKKADFLLSPTLQGTLTSPEGHILSVRLPLLRAAMEPLCAAGPAGSMSLWL
jgi:hypothetical protein